MNRQVAFALANPVFDPTTQILPGHHWLAERLVVAGLTVNLGME